MNQIEVLLARMEALAMERLGDPPGSPPHRPGFIEEDLEAYLERKRKAAVRAWERKYGSFGGTGEKPE